MNGLWIRHACTPSVRTILEHWYREYEAGLGGKPKIVGLSWG